jgi:hypothetical protein
MARNLGRSRYFGCFPNPSSAKKIYRTQRPATVAGTGSSSVMYWLLPVSPHIGTPVAERNF